MNRKNISKLVEGAMITSIFSVLFLFDLYLGGGIGYILYFFLPSFIVWYNFRYTLKDTLILGFVIVLTTLFVSNPLNILYVTTSTLVGCSVGELYKKRKSESEILVVSTFMTLLSNVLMYTIFASLFNLDLYRDMIEMYDMITQINPNLNISKEAIMQLIPIVIFILSLIESYCILMIMCLILPRLKVEFKYRFNFLTLRISKQLGLLFCISLFLSMFIRHQFLYFLNIIFFFIFCIGGLSFSAYYFAYKKQKLLYFLSFLAIFFPGFSLIYFMLGVVDCYYNLRARIR